MFFSFRGDALRIGAVLIAALAIRLVVASLGHNYDLESYWLVSKLVDDGRNVYANTHRYNYGPLWFLTPEFLLSNLNQDCLFDSKVSII